MKRHKPRGYALSLETVRLTWLLGYLRQAIQRGLPIYMVPVSRRTLDAWMAKGRKVRGK